MFAWKASKHYRMADWLYIKLWYTKLDNFKFPRLKIFFNNISASFYPSTLVHRSISPLVDSCNSSSLTNTEGHLMLALTNCAILWFVETCAVKCCDSILLKFRKVCYYRFFNFLFFVKREVSLVEIVRLSCSQHSLGKLFMYIKNKLGPKIELWGTPTMNCSKI